MAAEDWQSSRESAMARFMLEHDLKGTPMGMAPGDPAFDMPMNHAAPTARVFLRNWSATQKRQYVKIGVSDRRGMSKALLDNKELQKTYGNVAMMKESVREGVDLNVYDMKVQPVMFAPLWDGRRWPVAPAPNPETQPTAVQVPEGMWDLFMGNWDRMHSPSPQIRAEEQVRLATSMLFKQSSILFVTVDQNQEVRDNPFGFIEIIRLTEKMIPVAPDTEFLTALDLVES
jgi:hypothetical protein